MGTPEFSVPSLRMLIEEGYDVAAAVTQPDRLKGRSGKPAEPPVKQVARDAGIRVFQPEKPGDILTEVSALAIDLCVTAAYGKILKRSFLGIPRFGTVNVHASLLPLYRGPSPIHRALLNGDKQTGVTTMLTQAGVDTGPILLSESIGIDDNVYYTELYAKLADLGAGVLKKTIPLLLSGGLAPIPQDDALATYAPIVEKTDGELDFSQGAQRLVNRVRAFCEWPGAVAWIGGRKVRVYRAEAGGCPDLDAAAGTVVQVDRSASAAGTVVQVDRGALSIKCGDNSVFRITRLQFEGGRVMDISECWHNLPKMLDFKR